MGFQARKCLGLVSGVVQKRENPEWFISTKGSQTRKAHKRQARKRYFHAIVLKLSPFALLGSFTVMGRSCL
uniref:Uncharacterized protein n=1 Tax=Romanomermis culicivorax TaxID=13658 RepID=A0A915HDZ3_ROMCU